jgi:hypothetical protein
VGGATLFNRNDRMTLPKNEHLFVFFEIIIVLFYACGASLASLTRETCLKVVREDPSKKFKVSKPAIEIPGSIPLAKCMTKLFEAYTYSPQPITNWLAFTSGVLTFVAQFICCFECNL